jgi:hypothetical protein
VKVEETTKLELAIDIGKLEKLKSQPVTVKVEETTKLKVATSHGHVRGTTEPAEDSEKI